jgi:hypothetical protein
MTRSLSNRRVALPVIAALAAPSATTISVLVAVDISAVLGS